MNFLIQRLTKLLQDWLTSADGETYAVGRGLGIVLFFVGLLLPSILAGYVLFTQHPPLHEWVGFLGGLSAYIPTLVGAVTLLIWGTNSTEPVDPSRWPHPQLPRGEDHHEQN